MNPDPRFDTVIIPQDVDPSKLMCKQAPHIFVDIEKFKANPEAMMIHITSMLEATFQSFINTSNRDGLHLDGIRVSWHNIPHAELNPDGLIGGIRVTGTATKL